MTFEILNPNNKLRDQREYTIISEHPKSKCEPLRIIVQTLNQMDDMTVLNAT